MGSRAQNWFGRAFKWRRFHQTLGIKVLSLFKWFAAMIFPGTQAVRAVMYWPLTSLVACDIGIKILFVCRGGWLSLASGLPHRYHTVEVTLSEYQQSVHVYTHNCKQSTPGLFSLFPFDRRSGYFRQKRTVPNKIHKYMILARFQRTLAGVNVENPAPQTAPLQLGTWRTTPIRYRTQRWRSDMRLLSYYDHWKARCQEKNSPALTE